MIVVKISLVKSNGKLLLSCSRFNINGFFNAATIVNDSGAQRENVATLQADSRAADLQTTKQINLSRLCRKL